VIEDSVEVTNWGEPGAPGVDAHSNTDSVLFAPWPT